MSYQERSHTTLPDVVIRLTIQKFYLQLLSELRRRNMYTPTTRLAERISSIGRFLDILFHSDLLTSQEKKDLNEARKIFIQTLNNFPNLRLGDFTNLYQNSHLSFLIDAYAGGFLPPAKEADQETYFWTVLQSLSIEAIPLDDQSLQEYKRRIRTAFAEAREFFDQETHFVEIENSRPTMVLADIHGRRQFILDALTKEIEIDAVCASVYSHICAHRLDLMFVGDFSHPEIGNDWTMEKKKGDTQEIILRQGRQLDQVMSDSLGTLRMVCALKHHFPDQVFMVSGNHDNVYGVGGTAEKTGFELIKNGINQNALARSYLSLQFGDDFLRELSQLERAIPLMISKKNLRTNTHLIVSHAAPTRPLDKQDIQTNSVFAQVELTFNNNTPARLGEKGVYRGVVETLVHLGVPLSQTFWIIGHCVVEPDQTSRRQIDSRLVQICDPYRQLVAFVPADMNSVDTYEL